MTGNPLDTVVCKLFRGRASLAELIEAFSIEHTFQGQTFTSWCDAEADKDGSVWVRGGFISKNIAPKDAGSFSRHFYRRNEILRVYHASIIVAPEHRHKYIATAHYTKLIQFYVEHGIENIRMDANQDGPVIWPGFGLQLVHYRDTERLIELVRRELHRLKVREENLPESLETLGDYTPLLAALRVSVGPGVAIPRDPLFEDYVEGEEGGPRKVAVGLLGLMRLYLERGEELEMTIWLNREKPLKYLAGRGILPRETIR